MRRCVASSQKPRNAGHNTHTFCRAILLQFHHVSRVSLVGGVARRERGAGKEWGNKFAQLPRSVIARSRQSTFVCWSTHIAVDNSHNDSRQKGSCLFSIDCVRGIFKRARIRARKSLGNVKRTRRPTGSTAPPALPRRLICRFVVYNVAQNLS